MTETKFAIKGKPVGKARPRFTRSGHVYTPKKTVDYEKIVKAEYLKAGGSLIDGDVSVTIYANFKKSCIIRPDCDNIAKIILDGLNGTAYADDKQVTNLQVIKKISESEFVEVIIEKG